jgi:hypothetical protein
VSSPVAQTNKQTRTTKSPFVNRKQTNKHGKQTNAAHKQTNTHQPSSSIVYLKPNAANEQTNKRRASPGIGCDTEALWRESVLATGSAPGAVQGIHGYSRRTGAALLETGMVRMVEPHTTFRLEAPCGLIDIRWVGARE